MHYPLSIVLYLSRIYGSSIFLMGLPNAVYAEWVELVSDIRGGNEHGAERLYETLSGGARGTLACNLGSEFVDDHLHDIVVIVLEAIHSGALRDPTRLMGFVRTITRRRVAAGIRGNMRRRLLNVALIDTARSSAASPEAAASAHEQHLHAMQVLSTLCLRDQEILARFYLKEQEPEQICQEMRLTTNQFRLYKSRALSRCSVLLRRSEKAWTMPPKFSSRASRFTSLSRSAKRI
jgi:DNA-directed RNA polymerase specialized sigma24 family protein